jgi:hypothetical protein
MNVTHVPPQTERCVIGVIVAFAPELIASNLESVNVPDINPHVCPRFADA